MVVTAAERDKKREQAFALAMQRVPYREISQRLEINKSTVVEYVRTERARRSHDRDAEDAIRDVTASLRLVLTDLHEQYGRISGDSPHSMYARAKVAEQVRKIGRDLIGLYGLTLPDTDPEVISAKRMVEMMAAPLPTPGGYPEVGDQAVLERHIADLEDEADFSFQSWEDMSY